MDSLVSSALNKSKQTDCFLSACPDKLGFHSNDSSSSVQPRRMFASDSLWVLGEIGAVMCVFVPLLVLTLDRRGHAEFALQRRDARYMHTFLSANGLGRAAQSDACGARPAFSSLLL